MRFFFGHRLIHGDTFADHIGDLLLLLLEHTFFNALELGLTFAADDLEQAVFFHALGFDLDHPLAIFLSNFNLALFILVGDHDLFFGLDLGELRAVPFFGADFGGFGFFAGLDGLDLTLLASGGFGLLALEGTDGLKCFGVLLFDLLLFRILELVGEHLLLSGQLGDLTNALAVEDVIRVELFDGGLLQIVDGHVFEHVAVEVASDDLDDLVFKRVTLFIEVFKLHALADGLESLGELGAEELLEGILGGGAHAADGLRHLEHVLFVFVHAHEEGHFNVCTDIIHTDQTFLAGAVDLDALNRDVHDLRAIDHRPDERTGKGDFHPSELVDDEGLALLHLEVKLACEGCKTHRHHQQKKNGETHCRKQRGWNFHAGRLQKNQGDGLGGIIPG